MVLIAAVLLAVPEANAQMARISGKVLDPAGQPVDGVAVTVTTPDSERFKLEKTSNKKGAVTLVFNNLEFQYDIRFEKEGYQTKSEPLYLTSGGTVKVEWILVPNDAASLDGGGDAPAGAGGGSGNRAVRTYNEGVEAQRLGDLELAEERYRKAIEINPDLATPHTALAAVLLQREDYSASAAEAETALTIDPSDVRALQIRFEAYRLAGDTENAQAAADALREVGNLDQAAARIFNEGVDAYSANDTATAVSKFQQVLQLDPQMVSAYVALAQIFLAQGAPGEAGAMAQKALENEPDNVTALKLGYDAARISGDAETAEANLSRLADLDPDWMSTVLYEHAGELFNANQLDAAILELQYVLKANPDLARAHYLLGMSYFNSGRVEEGRTELQKFIELAPDDPDVEIAKGLLSYQQ
jgi:tetratricopeptide (TPR) repeat protein